MGIYISLKSEFKEFNIQCKIKLCLEKKDQMQINFQTKYYSCFRFLWSLCA